MSSRHTLGSLAGWLSGSMGAIPPCGLAMSNATPACISSKYGWVRFGSHSPVGLPLGSRRSTLVTTNRQVFMALDYPDKPGEEMSESSQYGLLEGASVACGKSAVSNCQASFPVGA